MFRPNGGTTPFEWKQQEYEQRLDARIVNYADDFAICCKTGKADEAMTAMREMMGKLKRTVNEQKTRQCSVPSETFSFLALSRSAYRFLGKREGCR